MKKAHQRYRLENGNIVPGVTTVLGVMAKPALVSAANKLGLEGYNAKDVWGEKATIGTLVHEYIEMHNNDTDMDYSDYTETQRKAAMPSIEKYHRWEAENNIYTLKTELQLVSEKYKVGGTVDWYGTMGEDRKKVIIDYKTGGVYGESHTQQSAYWTMMEENGYQVDEAYLLRLGTEEDGDAVLIPVSRRELHWERFLVCRELYELNKKLRRK